MIRVDEKKICDRCTGKCFRWQHFKSKFLTGLPVKTFSKTRFAVTLYRRFQASIGSWLPKPQRE